jgi:hypothetical protein
MVNSNYFFSFHQLNFGEMVSMRGVIRTFFLLAFLPISAQQDSLFFLKGQVLAPDGKTPLPEVHVVNKNKTIGTITTARGLFSIDVHPGDTVVFSNISYKYVYHFVTAQDSSKSMRVVMEERNFMLDEVSIFTYELTTNQEKPMKMGRPMIPKSEDIKDPEPGSASLASPVDYIYQLFSNRERQLRALQELRKQDSFREQLNKGQNREVLLRLTGLSTEELEQMLFFCRYSRSYINHATDYELLISLLLCFEEYQSVRQREQILDEWESR